MNRIDLSAENVKKHCQAFAGLSKVPSISVSENADVNILFFKRRDRYFGLRAGQMSDFETRDEFLIYSVLVEAIGAKIKSRLAFDNLKVEECSNELLGDIYTLANRVNEHLPSISEVGRSFAIVNNSELNWVFLA